MKEIPLRNGMVTTVDDADYNRLMAHIWAPRKGRRDAWYAYRSFTLRQADGSVKHFCREMQREIMDPDMTLSRLIFVDHEDHNTLNNQRYNLRLLTPRESTLNRRLSKNNTLGYRGIYRKDGLFDARIMSNGFRYGYSGFKTAEEAAAAYNELAIEHHGEHAKLNIIVGVTR